VIKTKFYLKIEVTSIKKKFMRMKRKKKKKNKEKKIELLWL